MENYRHPGLHSGDGSGYSPGYYGDGSTDYTVTSWLEQPSYPAIFQPREEIPRFYVSYRWWEDEATTTLWAFDVEEIKRVICYGLFQDESLPRTSLQSRNAEVIDTLLLSLVEPHEAPFVAGFSHLQKVEEILRRSQIGQPLLVPWSWFPSHSHRGLDPPTVAAMIDAESHLHFTHVPFQEWVRYSLGYPTATVQWFFDQHAALFFHLLSYLDAHPEEVDRYIEIEKNLRTRSPFAHRALVRCLYALHARFDYNAPSSPNPGFEFIAGPIQRIFQDHPTSLATILKALSVLSIRFRRTYVHATEIDWTLRFDTSIPFVDDLLGSSSPVDLARTLTSSNELEFAHLSERSIIANDSAVQQLIGKWQDLCTQVWECCSTLPDTIETIQECLHVSPKQPSRPRSSEEIRKLILTVWSFFLQVLLIMRNYHALTAIINGLQRYRASTLRSITFGTAAGTVVLAPLLPPNLVYLMNPYGNFAAYRQLFQGAPGVPFLVPHLRDFKQHGAIAVTHLMQAMRKGMHYGQ
ncbi:hypothetical protein ASPZODRAFT_146185 [Penicilliopsis zonata CBS 506.65]|uniref:Ras-GEF domain-containing protein n=1 Tax=Penicilliopsis zonata CBS 506.65 TaxID=1073090 RepID=A0A1L9S8I0_9EURO|nr:hypothetical protein ASPZODRAFT_146185 [Penicilliopsis zonata CBS 506.65]OJJ43471.1 hypothetical protein ASPZODRAFT_146185 [Penicilliopsis zonata CBS 506.65]